MATAQPRAAQSFFEGFLVRCADGDIVRKRAAVVVGDGWRTRPVLPSLFHLVPPRGSSLPPKRAFAAARALVCDGVDDAEAAFRTLGLYPTNPKKELLPEERPSAAPPASRARGKKAAPQKSAGTNDCEWALGKAGVKAAWAQYNVSGAGVVVAHPDTGYTFHDEIDSPRLRWQEGYDYEEGDNDPQDELVGSFPLNNPGHGTATGSVIMSDKGTKTARKTFVSGAAYDASLVPFRVNTRVEHFSFVNLIYALSDARAKGLDVASMSLGGPLQSDALEEEVRRCTEAGMILIAAAGQVWPWVIYPARLPEVIGVGAVDIGDQPWKECASGPTIDISGPGVDVWVATVKKSASGNKYDVATSSGTSHATAITAGIACLWLEHHGGGKAVRTALGGRVADVFRAALQKSARVPAGWPPERYGAGIVDAASALAAPLGSRLRVGARGYAESGPSWLALLPGVKPEDIDASTALLSGKKAKSRENFDRELHYQLATSPELRRTFRKTRAAGAKARGGMPKSLLGRFSPELAAFLR